LAASSLFSRQGEGFALSQLITDLGRTSNLVASSRLSAQAASQMTLATRDDVVLGVNRAYFGVLQAQAMVKVAEETVRARQTLADQVSALGKAQLKSQVDVSFAEVNLSEAQLLLIRAKANLQQAFADLGRALGIDTPAVQFQLVDSAPSGAPPDGVPGLVAQAIQSRPELAELRLRYQAAQKFETAESDLKRPVLSAVAVGGALPYIQQDPRTLSQGYEGIALNLSIPVFNGHLFNARQQEAHFRTLAASQRVRDLQQQVDHDVRVAWLAASTAYQRIPVAQQLVSQAELSQRLAKGRYDLGLSSIVELTQSELNLTQAQIESVAAQYEYQSAFAELQYTIGALR